MTITSAPSTYKLSAGEGLADLWWKTGRVAVTATGDQTGGRLSQVEIDDPLGTAPPLHIHRDADETFYVIAGTVSVFVGDERMDAGPGDYVFAPMGIPHAFLVTSEYAEMLVTFVGAGTEGPLGAGVHGFFSEVAVPVVQGEQPPAPAIPDAAEFAARMAVYGIDLVGPPPAV